MSYVRLVKLNGLLTACRDHKSGQEGYYAYGLPE